MPKIGLDDYLLTHTKEEFDALPALDPDDPAFAGDEDWHKDWREKKTLAVTVPNIGKIHLTDLGNGERFALREKDNIAYSQDLGWRYYNGKYWVEDKISEVLRRAAACVRNIYIEAAQTNDQERREALAKWAAKSEAAPRVNAMVEMSKAVPGISVEPEIWDRDTWSLNLKNGTLDLQSQTIREHRRQDLITKYIDINYSPDAQCPNWLKFLETVMPNQDDQLFLQKAVGYSLTGSIREQCFFILFGTGKNGKSTFLKTLRSILGEYAGVLRTETLMVKKFDAIPTDIASLRGLRFTYASENERNGQLAASLVKQMTGGEELRARFLYGRDFSFTPTNKLWIGVNHEPRISDTDEGIWRRVRKIPFTVTISDDQDDKDLGDKLLLESEGILAWAIEGCRLWLNSDLKATENIVKATNKYRESSDILKDFYEECLVFGPTLSASKKDVLSTHETWAKNIGEKPLSSKALSQRLREKGFGETKHAGTRYWTGFEINTENHPTNDTNATDLDRDSQIKDPWA